jgi:hypothetical protein
MAAMIRQLPCPNVLFVMGPKHWWVTPIPISNDGIEVERLP